MSYVQDNLMPNEQVLYKARIHPAIFLPAVTTFILGGIILAGRFIFADQIQSNGMTGAVTGALCLGALFIFLAITYAVQAEVTLLTTEFAVTDRRLIAKTGFIRRHTLEMLLGKIESVAVSQDIAGRVLNFGSLTVTGTGGTKERFTAIADPLGVRRQINQILEQYTQTFTPAAASEEPVAVG